MRCMEKNLEGRPPDLQSDSLFASWMTLDEPVQLSESQSFDL